jgi:Nitrile hydratase beta subunit
VADRFAPGDRVRTRTADPPGHTRLPRYARGVCGEIVGTCGRHPLADERAQGLASSPRAVYQVRFAAGDLFGPGEDGRDHAVVVELWEDYLEPAHLEGDPR